MRMHNHRCANEFNVGKWVLWYNGSMANPRTERLTTTSQRKKMREEATDKNVRLYGRITCENCYGIEGEVHDSGKTIQYFEMDHKINVSSAGVDRRLRWRYETDPDNHWMLCNVCHDIKTKWEIEQGKKRASGRSKRKHPGVIG